MRARTGPWTLTICLLIASNAARAQEALQVVDGDDRVLGPVVGVLPGSGGGARLQFLFAYRQDDRISLLRMEHFGRITEANPSTANPVTFYYQTADCSGAPALATNVSCCLPHDLSPVVAPDALGQLWKAELSLVDRSVASSRVEGFGDDIRDCEAMSPQLMQGVALTAWGTLAFTSPARVEPTPFIFGDDFSSQNLAPWSNF